MASSKPRQATAAQTRRAPAPARVLLCYHGARWLATGLGDGDDTSLAAADALPTPLQVHRHTNPLVVGAANDGLVAGIITDGFHLPPDVLKVLLRTKGVERLYITSDAASAAGLPPGVNY